MYVYTRIYLVAKYCINSFLMNVIGNKYGPQKK